MRGSLPTHVAGTRGGDEYLVRWRGVEKVGGVVVDVLRGSCVDDEPEVGRRGGGDV